MPGTFAPPPRNLQQRVLTVPTNIQASAPSAGAVTARFPGASASATELPLALRSQEQRAGRTRPQAAAAPGSPGAAVRGPEPGAAPLGPGPPFAHAARLGAGPALLGRRRAQPQTGDVGGRPRGRSALGLRGGAAWLRRIPSPAGFLRSPGPRGVWAGDWGAAGKAQGLGNERGIGGDPAPSLLSFDLGPAGRGRPWAPGPELVLPGSGPPSGGGALSPGSPRTRRAGLGAEAAGRGGALPLGGPRAGLRPPPAEAHTVSVALCRGAGAGGVPSVCRETPRGGIAPRPTRETPPGWCRSRGLRLGSAPPAPRLSLGLPAGNRPRRRQPAL